jgi:ferredoxin-NADP reductase
MPVATDSSQANARSPRRLGRRLLGSSLLDALAGPHGVDRYLELVRPAWTLKDARAEVVSVERQTADSVTLGLRPNVAWTGFEAGQFIQLAVEIDGVRRTRCYSPAGSAASPGELELTIKRHPEGLVSAYLNERARPGMVVGLSAADGDFTLPPERPQRLLLISGGSGITPVLSILRTLCDEAPGEPITFLHYAPEPALALYRELLDELSASHPNLLLVRAYTRSADGELEGHFSRGHLLEAAPDFADAETFVCGPPGLVETARAIWAEDELEPRLHIESFLPPALAIRSDSAEGVIRFAEAGMEVSNSGRSILEQAEAAGLSPAFGCRMGICHSCTCRKTAGSVRNLRSGELSSNEDEEIQICVSAPVGDVEIEL